MKSLNQSIIWLLNQKYKGRMTKEAEKDILRLKKGEPVDYVIGYKDFLGCKIDLRFKPLIPREETEFWVKKAIEDLRTSQKLRVLDMFAGSGCIGVAILKHISGAVCDFCDIDENCLKQIELNLKINKIAKSRYRIFKTDIFNQFKNEYSLKPNFKLQTSSYSCIFANPPYVDKKNTKKVQKSVLNFEPQKAVFAKDGGLYFIKKFLQEAKKYLDPNGKIYLEFGQGQKNAISKILKNSGYSVYKFYSDQFGKWRWVVCGGLSSKF